MEDEILKSQKGCHVSHGHVILFVNDRRDRAVRWGVMLLSGQLTPTETAGRVGLIPESVTPAIHVMLDQQNPS